MVPQPKAAPNLLAEMPSRIVDRLTALRTFFAEMEPQLPAIVARSYERLFDVEPAIALLFKGNAREHQLRFLAKLQSIVKLTRSSQLWPASAATGGTFTPGNYAVTGGNSQRHSYGRHRAIGNYRQ